MNDQIVMWFVLVLLLGMVWHNIRTASLAREEIADLRRLLTGTARRIPKYRTDIDEGGSAIATKTFIGYEDE